MSIGNSELAPSREELHALVDDELDPARVESIDQWASLSHDNATQLRSEVSAIRELKQALASLPAAQPDHSDLENQLLENRLLENQIPGRPPGSTQSGEPEVAVAAESTPAAVRSVQWWQPALAAMLVAAVGAGYVVGQSNRPSVTDDSVFPGSSLAGATWVDSDDPVPGWVEQAANYQAMYVTDTLAHTPTETTSPVQLEQRLSAALGAAVRVPSLPAALQFKRGQVLESGGQPVIQLAWLHDNGEPVAVCVTAAGKLDSDGMAKDLQSGQLQQLRFVTWRQAGLEYVIMGRFEHARLRDWAEAVQQELNT